MAPCVPQVCRRAADPIPRPGGSAARFNGRIEAARDVGREIWGHRHGVGEPQQSPIEEALRAAKFGAISGEVRAWEGVHIAP